MRIVVGLLLAGLLCGNPAQAAALPPFRNDAATGPYAAGFRVVEQYDYSRTFQPEIDELGRPNPGERARPIQTLVWYPAEKSSGRTMTWGDYVALDSTQVSFGKPRAIPVAADYFKTLIAPSAGEPEQGIRNAKPEAGQFPVVVYAPSFSAWPWENAEFCEYLASWGYVVIASPGMGIGYFSTHDLAGVDAQARDIGFLVGYAQSLPDADAAHLAVMGFSWGGLANLFAAATDNRIKALVDLDGSIRYWPGLVKAAGIDPSHMAIPLLFFKSQDSIEMQSDLESAYPVASGPSVLNSWTEGDYYSVEMLRIVHPEFCSIVFRNPDFWKNEFDRLQPADFSREDGIRSFAIVERYTKAFLDYYLKKQAEGLSFLQAPPAEQGIPAHFIGVKVRPGKGRPFDFSDFRVAVHAAGFERLAATYADEQKSHPGFALSSGDLQNWAGDLVRGGHAAEGIAVARFALAQQESSDGYDSLGTAYLAAGQTSDAVAAFERALAAKHDDYTAQSALREIKAGKPEPAGQ